MPEPVLLKIGGSVLTKKGGPGSVWWENLAMISREIADHCRTPLLIVHGAGSCGHPEAYRFRLMEGLTGENREGVFTTHLAVSKLNSIVVTSLREKGIEAIGIHPLDSCYAENGRIVSMECRHIREMLTRGIVPVLHGDVVMDGINGATIVSGDQLVSYLGRTLRFGRIGLATDVPGVLAGDAVIPVLTPQTISQVRIGSSRHTDVTGGMEGKIRELLALASEGTCSEIFHVEQTGAFLEGRPHGGTVVRGG
jgi:isopentenyl phosphate kinase